MAVRQTIEQIIFEGVDRVSGVAKGATGAVGQLRASVDSVKGALAGIGVTVGAGAIVALHMDTLKATAALDDMAESTGASVEGLSAIQRVAKVGGHDFEGLTSQIGKMIKGLKDGGEEGSKTARALAHVGVETRDANGNFRDTSRILVELSEKLGKYTNDGDKVRLIQDALGRGAERYLPLLKDMAEKTDLYATVTAKQAAQAEEAEKNINRLRVAMEDGRRELVTQYTPAVIDLTNKLLDASKAAGGVVQGIAMLAMQPLGRSLDEQLGEVSKKIEAIEAGAAKNPRLSQSLIGSEGPIGGTRLMALYREKEFLQAQQRRAALALATPDTLDARDLRLRGGAAEERLDYGGGMDEKELKFRAEAAQRYAEMEAQDRLEASEAQKKYDILRQEREQKQAEAEQTAAQARQSRAEEEERRADEIQARAAERAADEIARIQGIGRTEEQQAEARYRAKLRVLELGLLDQESFAEAADALAFEHEQELTRIQDEETRKRFGISEVHRKLDMNSARTFFGTMSSLMNTKSRELFEIGKAAAIGEAIVNTYNAATGAYAALAKIPIVGPALGAAAAAAAILAGMANVNAIRSQKFGGSGGATPTFPASPTTGLPVGSPLPDAAGGGSRSPTTIINVRGQSISKEQLQEIVDELNDNTENGGRIIVK